MSPSYDLTKIGHVKHPTTYIATVVSNTVGEDQGEYDDEPRIRWIQELKMLNIDNRDALGREVNRRSKNNVFGKAGREAGEGSGVQIKADAYSELLGVDSIGDGAITVGKTFRFESRQVSRGTGTDDEGNTREFLEKVDVPVEYLPNGYVHPADRPRPVWAPKVREVADIRPAAEVEVTATVSVSEDEVDEVLAKMYDGQASAPTLQTLISNSATKSQTVIRDVKSGAALQRLLDKGLLVEDEGKYVKLG